MQQAVKFYTISKQDNNTVLWNKDFKEVFD